MHIVHKYIGIRIQPGKGQLRNIQILPTLIQLQSRSVLPVLLIDPLQLVLILSIKGLRNQPALEQIGMYRSRHHCRQPRFIPASPKFPIRQIKSLLSHESS
ncbi:hypothetical protein D3C81_1780880 [compost metagenome]